jgi:hypothetical protein
VNSRDVKLSVFAELRDHHRAEHLSYAVMATPKNLFLRYGRFPFLQFPPRFSLRSLLCAGVRVCLLVCVGGDVGVSVDVFFLKLSSVQPLLVTSTNTLMRLLFPMYTSSTVW